MDVDGEVFDSMGSGWKWESVVFVSIDGARCSGYAIDSMGIPRVVDTKSYISTKRLACSVSKDKVFTYHLPP